jgi:hypothetical protein
MKTELIKIKVDYAEALAQVEKLMDAKPGTPQKTSWTFSARI